MTQMNYTPTSTVPKPNIPGLFFGELQRRNVVQNATWIRQQFPNSIAVVVISDIGAPSVSSVFKLLLL